MFSRVTRYMYWCEVVGSGGVTEVHASWPILDLYQKQKSLKRTSCHQAGRAKFNSEDSSSEYLLRGL